MNSHPANQDKNQSGDNLPKTDDAHIVDSASGLQKPNPTTEQQQRKRHAYHIFGTLPVRIRTDYLTLLVSVITLAVLGMYTEFAKRQWYTSEKSAKAARDSADAAKDTLATIRRPWVALNTADKGILLYGDLGFAVSGVSGSSGGSGFNVVTAPEGAQYANFSLCYSVKNYGGSPANVEINTEVINNPTNYPFHGPELVTKVDNFCDKDYRDRVSLKQHSWPATIVPGEMNINVRRRLEIPKGTLEIKPTVMGCIWYHPTIGKDEEIHRTPFSGNISMKEDVNHNPADDLNPVAIPVSMGRIPKGNLRIVDVMMMGKTD